MLSCFITVSATHAQLVVEAADQAAFTFCHRHCHSCVHRFNSLSAQLSPVTELKKSRFIYQIWQQTYKLTKNRDVVLDEECNFIIWNVTQEVKSLAECTLHQTDSISCQHSVSYLQCSFPAIVIIMHNNNNNNNNKITLMINSKNNNTLTF